MTSISTFSQYRFYAGNLQQSMKRVAAEPMVKRDEQYYSDNIGKVKNVDDLQKNYRLYSFAMTAYGLSDMMDSKAFMKKVLTSDLTDTNSFANKLQDKRFKTFAAAFNFNSKGAVTSVTPIVQSDAISTELEGLYSQKAAASASAIAADTAYYKFRLGSIKTVPQLLADSRLYDYILTAQGLDPATESQETIAKVLTSDVSDPKSFANTSKNAKYVALAADFNFASDGTLAAERLPQANIDLKATVAAYLANSASGTPALTAAKTEATNYAQAIGAINSVDEFLANSHLVDVAKRAFGLDGVTTSKDMLRKVLTSDLSDRSSFVNTLPDDRYRALAAAFNFTANGSVARSTATVQSSNDRAVTRANYERQTMQTKAGEQSEGVRLALYFQQNAPKITSSYGILADKALLTVVQTALNIPAATSKADITKQAAMIDKKLKIADLKDPAKLDKFIARFAAFYDLANGQNAEAAGSSMALSILTSQGS